MKAKTSSWPTLCIIPPRVEMPMTLTRFGPNVFKANITRKLNSVPEKPYKKVEKVPLRKVESNSFKKITLALSIGFKVNMASIVIRLAIPSLAPGAKAKGVGMKRS